MQGTARVGRGHNISSYTRSPKMNILDSNRAKSTKLKMSLKVHFVDTRFLSAKFQQSLEMKGAEALSS